jgi:hypothetical protein
MTTIALTHRGRPRVIQAVDTAALDGHQPDGGHEPSQALSPEPSALSLEAMAPGRGARDYGANWTVSAMPFLLRPISGAALSCTDLCPADR